MSEGVPERSPWGGAGRAVTVRAGCMVGSGVPRPGLRWGHPGGAFARVGRAVLAAKEKTWEHSGFSGSCEIRIFLQYLTWELDFLAHAKSESTYI
jgi:hypothetical protein